MSFSSSSNILTNTPPLPSRRRNSPRASSLPHPPPRPFSSSKSNPSPSSFSSLSSSSAPNKRQQPRPFTTLSAAVAGAGATLIINLITLPDAGSGNGIGGGGCFNGGGGGGGGFYDGLGFLKRLFCSSTAIADEDQSPDWDNHGLPANIAVQLNKLSQIRKYKVSDILFFDQRRRTTLGNEDSFFEVVSLRPGGVYTGSLLQKEPETLAMCEMFEKVDLEGRTNPVGTLGITISFTEST